MLQALFGDNLIRGFLFSIIATGFGWLLNEASQFIRARGDDKRSVKRVLFNLLEVHYLFLRVDLDKVLDMVVGKVLVQLPREQQTPQVKEGIKSFYSSTLKTLLKDELGSRVMKAKAGYEASVNELASIDPVSAFRLSGKTFILYQFDLIENWFGNVKEMHPNHASQIEKSASIAMDAIKPPVTKEDLEELEDSIREVAFEAGIITWIKTRKQVRKSKKFIEVDIEKKLDSMMAMLKNQPST